VINFSKNLKLTTLFHQMINLEKNENLKTLIKILRNLIMKMNIIRMIICNFKNNKLLNHLAPINLLLTMVKIKSGILIKI
jgi:hypothetical protein